MTDFWTCIEGLENRTVHTLDQSKPFDVIKVTAPKGVAPGPACIIAVPSQDKTRPKIRVLYRDDLAPLYAQLRKHKALTIDAIKETYKFSSSYASALLAAVDGVEASTRPIRLSMAS